MTAKRTSKDSAARSARLLRVWIRLMRLVRAADAAARELRTAARAAIARPTRLFENDEAHLDEIEGHLVPGVLWALSHAHSTLSSLVPLGREANDLAGENVLRASSNIWETEDEANGTE